MTELVSRRGRGKAGFCKICAFAYEHEVNLKLKAGLNARQVNDFAKDKWGFSATRQTWYEHKKHITAPEDKVVAFANRQERGLKPVIKRTTNQEFLEAIRDIGMSQAEANPELVTLDQSLKAVQILEQSKKSTTEITLVLAQVVTGHSPDVEIVEGEAREVSVD